MTTFISKQGKGTGTVFDRGRLHAFVDKMTEDFPKLRTDDIKAKLERAITSHSEFKAEQINHLIQMTFLDEADMGYPEWSFVAARAYLQATYKKAAKNRGYSGKAYGDFYQLICMLVEKGVYTSTLLEHYTEEEIRAIGKLIVPERDRLFNFVGAQMLVNRYLATDRDGNVFELPQERWLIIAMHLLSQEDKEKRLDLIAEAYWALSNLYMTVATPTLANAGKSYGQLSSCFIDTVGDSLENIYASVSDTARVSKDGGGVALYLGKIRALGSSIKEFKGKSSGVIPWIKVINDTAVSVDQLGQRQGAVAVYLDIWHKDISAFLELRANNGDERSRARDIFFGVAIPDIFMEQVEKRGDWYLFDPHEVKKLMGYSLEDFYDEEKGNGSFRRKYAECVKHPLLNKIKVPAIEIIKNILKPQLEDGMPYMFYRDEVNRKNPNKHLGMIYCSNLCTEIAQNQSETKEVLLTEDGEVVKYERKMGDYVVCNLSSINLGRAVHEDVLARLIPIQVRMLDAVISVNTLPVPQASYNSRKYRAIGLGTFGWHHILALKGIDWESEASVTYADQLYEEIAFLTIQASNQLAKEKGAYACFEGSEWQTGKYFTSRGYFDGETSERWKALAEDVQQNGIRNGYLMAVAPNSSTATIAGSTNGIDPIFDIEYYEEKKDYRLKLIAPDISPETYPVYRRTAHLIDQHWSIKQNAARQRHIDQAISFNLFIRRDILAKDLLALHLDAWRSGLKTTYYVRSTSLDIQECEWCAS